MCFGLYYPVPRNTKNFPVGFLVGEGLQNAKWHIAIRTGAVSYGKRLGHLREFSGNDSILSNSENPQGCPPFQPIRGNR